MPDDPNNPQGPGNNNPQGPVNPDLSAALNVLSGLTTTMAALGETLEKTFTTVADMTDKVVDHLTDGVGTMKDFVKYSDNLQESYKEVANWSKKAQKIGKDQMRDTDKAKKELEKLMGIYNKILKDSKANRTETELLNKELDKVKKVYSEIGKAIKLNEEELAKVGEIVSDSTKNVLALAKALSQLRPSLAHFKGIMGMLGTVGIGKGINYKIDRRLEQIQELKDKTEETKKHRIAATREHMTNKRDAAFKEMKKMQEAGEPRQFDEKGKPTERGMQFLMKKMGFKGKKAADFKTGTMAEGFESEGATGVGYTAAMEGGSGVVGAMSTLSEGIEGAITTALTDFAPEIMIPIELLTGVIESLSKLFTTYVQQNKDMEKNLGKGGLFTAGFADAFSTARYALTPSMKSPLENVSLGITYKRNLDLAGAIANGGYNVSGSLRPDAPYAANMLPGANGGFMTGGLGLAQRSIFGAARIAGLSDTEGVEHLLKLLDKYGETLSTSERFFVQLNKDTSAAGISTTKYLKIIDEVSGHFDRMNKSLEATTDMMRNLSRYGTISSESLKDMMEFLQKGGTSQGADDMTKVFAAMGEDPRMHKKIIDNMKERIGDLADEFNTTVSEQQMGGKGIEVPTDIRKRMESGDTQGALNEIQRAQNRIAGLTGKDATMIQPLTAKLKDLTQLIEQTQGAETNPMKAEAMKKAMGNTVEQNNEETIRNIHKILQASKMSLGQFLGGTASNDSIRVAEEVRKMVAPSTTLADLHNRVSELSDQFQKSVVTTAEQGAPKSPERRSSLKELVNMFWNLKDRGGLAITLSKKGIMSMEQVMDKSMTQEKLIDALDSVDKNGQGLIQQGDINNDINNDGFNAMKNSEELLYHINERQKKDKITDKDREKDLDVARMLQRRETTPADAIGAIFQPWIFELIHGVEKLVDLATLGTNDTEALKKLYEEDKGSIQKEIDNTQKSMDDISQGLKDIAGIHTTEADKKRKELEEKGKNLLAWRNRLDLISGNQSYSTPVEAASVEAGLGLQPIAMDLTSRLPKQLDNGLILETKGGSNQPQYKIDQSSFIVNQFSAPINQDAGHSDSASVSNEQAGKQMHPAIAPWLNGGLPNRNQ